MHEKFLQLHLADMERGLVKTYAVFGLTPSQIAELTGVQFVSACDGFDYMLAALLQTAGGKQFSLRRYNHNPFQERTELIGSELSQSPTSDLNEFLEALQISDHFLLWRLTQQPTIGGI